MSFSQVNVYGNLCRDIELKYTPANVAVAEMSVAVNEKWKDKSGAAQEVVSYIDCVAFGKTAENLSRFFVKGQAVFLIGRLRQDRWEDKETGAKRSKVKVLVDNFQFTGSKQDGQQGGGTTTPAPARTGAKPAPANTGYEPIDESDLPF